jgi:integrase
MTTKNNKNSDPESDDRSAILTGEYFSLSSITAWVILDIRRPKPDGRYPVKYKITFLRKRVYYKAGIDMFLEEWEKMSNTKSRELISLREMIQSGFEKIKAHIKELESGEGFSIEALNKRLSRGMKNSVLSALYNKAEALKAVGRIGTSEWYYYSAKSIEKFTEHRDLKFSQITKDWLRQYEDFLLDNDRTYTTISMYLRALQAIVNEAKDQGIITQSQYPFGKGRYEIPIGEGRKLALTLLQISEVIKYPLISDTEKRCRDLWYFSYLCNGINMGDLLGLKYSNITNGEIIFKRKKTIRTNRRKSEITAILLPQMEEIINRWGNPDRKQGNHIFPFLRDGLSPIDEKRITKNVTRLINKKMMDIGNALGYGNISTYWARHSYATVLRRSGANIAFISESLGHADMKTTENYLSSFEKDERLKNAELLIPK